MKEKFQQFGKAMLVPVSLIALSGLFLGVGSSFTTQMIMESFGVNWDTYSTSFIFDFFLVIKGLGLTVIGNLGPLFAVGVAFSLSRKEKGWAAFSALICYLAMQNTIQVLLTSKGLSADNTSVIALMEGGKTALEASKIAGLYTTNLGFFTYNMGVFGGIIVGLSISYLHMKFYRTKLPVYLSFFSGTRTVPIIALVAGGVLGLFFNITWPIIGSLFTGIAGFVHDSGLGGTFIYRFLEESLVPFGMHPLLSVPMRWTELGGSMIVDGQLVVGNAAIQLAQLASPEEGKLLVRSFMGELGVIDYAIYPGIALAMYHTARPENRKKVLGLLIPAVVSAVLFGVTEPILFTFLFVAPWLYFLVYAPLAGLAAVLCEFFQVSVYQGNIKDLIPFLFRPDKLNLVPYLWLLPMFFILAYFLFKFLITHFNVLTPGRDEDEDEDDIHLVTKAEYNEAKGNELTKDEQGLLLASQIVEALGGKDNILDVDNCISRLRVVLKDASLMKEDVVFKKELQAMGVVHMGNAVQIIYGAFVATIATDVKEILGM